MWDIGTKAQILTRDNRAGPVRSIAWSPDGTHIATGTGLPNGITIWDVRAGEDSRLITTPLHCTTFSLAYSLDGKTFDRRPR